MSSPGPIHILGVGNLGKYVAYGLSKLSDPPPVTLLFHRPSQLDDWNAGGRAIHRISNGISERVTHFDVEVLQTSQQCIEGTRPSGPIKYLIVASKTYMTIAALSLVKDRLDSTSHILFLQNGMGMV